MYADCGTYRAYKRHYKQGGRPCIPCKDAANKLYRERYSERVGGLRPRVDRPKEVRKGHRWRVVREQVLLEEVDCWLCGNWINRTLKFPDDKSASVDHVIPVSKGGALLERDNLRAAHLGCNRDRGNTDFLTTGGDHE